MDNRISPLGYRRRYHAQELTCIMSTDDLPAMLSAMKVDELKGLARQLNVPKPSSLKTKDLLVSAILECDHRRIRSLLKSTWFDNHRVGLALTVLGIIITVVLGIAALPHWYNAPSSSVVAQFNKFGSLTLNLERRNALQNEEFDMWLSRTETFKNRYTTDAPPTEVQYREFVDEFVSFAESNFTPLQIKNFRGMESGAGGEMFRGVDLLTSPEHQNQWIQLSLIEFWLNDYIDHNRKNAEPIDPDKMAI